MFRRVSVVKATIKSKTNTSTVSQNVEWDVAEIVIKDQMKISPEFGNLTQETLHTLYIPRASSVRGKTELKSGQKYVISGRLETVGDQVRLVVDPCNDWIQLWSDVGHRHKALLRKSKFDLGCGCEVSLSPGLRREPVDMMFHVSDFNGVRRIPC